MAFRPIRRALLSVTTRPAWSSSAAGWRPRRRARLHRRHRRGPARGRLTVIEVGELTGSPEMLDGRVKTLHPGSTAASSPAATMPRTSPRWKQHGSRRSTWSWSTSTRSRHRRLRRRLRSRIEQIDIGGPAMIRAAAKNHDGVAVVVEPADYAALWTAVEAGGTDDALRRRLAAKAFARTAAYDAAIAAWLARETGEAFPERCPVPARRRSLLRYGENPHQRAALYATGGEPMGLAAAVSSRARSCRFNNLNDADAASRSWPTSPSPLLPSQARQPMRRGRRRRLGRGLPQGPGLRPEERLRRRRRLQPPARRRGRARDRRDLHRGGDRPRRRCGARAVFAAKPNLRLLTLDAMPDPVRAGHDVKWLAGGFLAQDRDTASLLPPSSTSPPAARPPRRSWPTCASPGRWSSTSSPTPSCLRAAAARSASAWARPAAWTPCSSPSGGPASMPAAGPASWPRTPSSPSPTASQAAIEAGATAAIQPGGSVRDQEVIAAADAAGIAMVLTGIRHFRH